MLSNNSKKLPYTMKNSHSVHTIQSHGGTTNLDTSDWPSLNNVELKSLDHSLNLPPTQPTVATAASTSIPMSKSCNFDANAEDKKQKQIKWKPLIVEPPKRERKSYRTGGRSRNGGGGPTDTNSSSRKSGGGGGGRQRTRSLDRNKKAPSGGEGGIETGESGENAATTNTTTSGGSRNRSSIVKSKSTTHRGFSDSQSVSQAL